ncbi:hypothetical protein N7495_001515 [Penicillium taxi]|uniref:uncharacterized protein n=1 Tax=Penicillium taxi TaxID=168475 RepID=UPI00254502C8|nr:uncharacterized protein N7495_001515 [Penicillium taxi]KAJ5908833.1 hypothetical protein N7495_001515 [Penicillium taxi]
MIPPCDPSILEKNPLFKRLYDNLTTSLLNPDGSTHAYDADPARTAAVEETKQCQIQTATKKIKESTLRQLAFAPESELSDEVGVSKDTATTSQELVSLLPNFSCIDFLQYHDNIAIISLYLETPRAAIDPEGPAQDGQAPRRDDALSLLAPEVETFYSNIPALILRFSNILSSAIEELRTIAITDSDTHTQAVSSKQSALSRSISAPSRPVSNHNARARARDRQVRTSMAPVPPLSSQLRDRVRALRHIQLFELPAARRKMAATAAEVLAIRTLVLERTVVILERVKHGALARATKAKVEHLATVAQGAEGKLEVTKLEIAAALYTPETLAALGHYRRHLQEARYNLEGRRAIAIDELKRYGDVEGSDADRGGNDRGPLAEITRRYGLLLKEVETVQSEIARLGE